MDLAQEVDDFIRESIDHSVGLPVSAQTLEYKLHVSEVAKNRIREQYLNLLARLKEKDEIIERARAESSMNAQAVKKFVEENQKLAVECSNLLNQCTKWERECSLYDHDREALMDFGNEADERAKEAEIRVHELEEELRRLSEELQFYKHQCEMQQVSTSTQSTFMEQLLLDSLMSTLVSKDEAAQTAHAFLEANSGLDVCQRMLKMWNSLQPSTQKVVALAAEVKSLQKDKELLKFNLTRAEEEVNILDEENKRLMRMCRKERNNADSSGKHTGSASAKGSKRKSSPKMTSPIEKKLDFSENDSPRQPLSTLQHNSPESRMHKKQF
ncbi:hypothetical protein RJ640_006557 [Escallonia rubra]|uniref:Uncharacterized protein n=2 Tax=Escallonia rubra TaxID=112253 RepID=A0AA88S3J1_9ASTE|nr:hypothetical protein RJ640_006557 [Escallonia rubra]